MRPSSDTTIAAIATATGGGIGIIRVSGPQAFKICTRVCSPLPVDLVSHHLYRGHVVDQESRETIDQVLFCMMRAPRSYTGEDVLEIHAHGGKINLQRILGVVLSAGAYAAAPGEFTKRGFLNGKLDLTKAEALAELIGAQTIRAARQAQKQLAGSTSNTIRELRKRAVQLLGELEGAMDFPYAAPDTTEEDAIHGSCGSDIRIELEEIARITRLLSESFYKEGKVLRSGVEVAFVGQPNAGKSSIINALCTAERLLVHDQPGTTRDYVEVHTEWNGIPFLLVDTAGHRTEATDVERLGIQLAQERSSRADLLVLVVDGLFGMSPNEHRLVEEESGRCIVVWNKIDQFGCLEPGLHEVVPCSALCGWGLDRLRHTALEMITPHIGAEGELVVTNERQARLLSQSACCFEDASRSLSQELSGDLVAADLRVAVELLGEIIGDVAGSMIPTVIDSIFAQLCIGK